MRCFCCFLLSSIISDSQYCSALPSFVNSTTSLWLVFSTSISSQVTRKNSFVYKQQTKTSLISSDDFAQLIWWFLLKPFHRRPPDQGLNCWIIGLERFSPHTKAPVCVSMFLHKLTSHSSFITGMLPRFYNKDSNK